MPSRRHVGLDARAVAEADAAEACARHDFDRANTCPIVDGTATSFSACTVQTLPFWT